MLNLEEKIEIHDQIKGKVKRKGSKKPVQEFIVGDDLYRKFGKWHHKESWAAEVDCRGTTTGLEST